jgi:uncharacterized protein (TIGR00369 family)
MNVMNVLPESPFSTDLGLKVIEWTPGKTVLSVELTERLQNRHGAGHGGVTATLLDVALAIAARSLAGDWVLEGTVTLNLQFLSPARGRLIAEGRLLKAGASVAFCEGEARDQNGTLIAKATATYKIERNPCPTS